MSRLRDAPAPCVDVDTAAAVLRAGGVIAMPTDTVYGLAASLDFPQAVERIYAIKGRPPEKAMPILVSNPDELQRLAVRVPRVALLLTERFWPGQLTVVVPAAPAVPEVVLRGGTTVGLRMPNDPVALALIAKSGGALAVTSANRSGEPEARSAAEVIATLGRDIDAVVDGGESPLGAPSTVVDATVCPPVVLRAGSLDPAELVAFLEQCGG